MKNNCEMKKLGVAAVLLVLILIVAGCGVSGDSNRFSVNGISLELPGEWKSKVEIHDNLLSYEGHVLDGDQLVVFTTLNVGPLSEQLKAVDPIEDIRNRMEEVIRLRSDSGEDITIDTEVKEGQANGIAYKYLDSTIQNNSEDANNEIQKRVVVYIPECNCMIYFNNELYRNRLNEAELSKTRDIYESETNQFFTILQSLSQAE